MINWILQEYKDAYCNEINSGLEPQFQDWWSELPGIKKECDIMVNEGYLLKKDDKYRFFL